MEIISAYLGLTLAFVIITFILLYFVINSKSHVILKAGAITVVIWYSLVLFYTPPRLMGWPTSQSLPDESRIIYTLVSEPRKGEIGSIYLIVISVNDDKKSLAQQINPKHIFDYNSKNTPRIYRIPYERKFHKNLEKAKKKAGPTGIIKLKKKLKKEPQNKGGKSSKKIEEEFKLEVLNPMELLTKD